MEEFYGDFFIAIISAILALVGNHFYSNNQRKKNLEKNRLVLIDIIENVIILNLERHKISYETLKEFFKDKVGETNTEHFLTHALDSNILSFFSQNDLVEILMSRRINVSLLYESIKDLELYKDHTPLTCQIEYTNTIYNVSKKYRNKYDGTGEYIHDENFIDEIKYHQTHVLRYIDERILNIDDKLKIFKDIVTRLKK